MSVPERCAEFIQFDTSNFGDARSRGETALATHIARILDAAGYDTKLYAREPHRGSLAVRVPGADRSLPGLLVHAHLDVVPVEPEQWSVPPFEGRIEDGFLIGRGAVDMKCMVGMMVHTLLDWAAKGIVPQRDLVFLFLADEEATGEFGSHWLVDAHPEIFAGVAAAIGESGAAATPLVAADGSGVMLYPIASAERGTLHMRLYAEGTSGHGSRPTDDSAVTKLLGATSRINTYVWPLALCDTTREYLLGTNTALGYEADVSSDAGVDAAIARMGSAGEVARVTVRCSATTTVLRAGYKINVIPGAAEAEVDARCVPGSYDSMRATLHELVGPDVRITFADTGEPHECSTDSEWFAQMRAAVLRHDPNGVVVPYCMGGATDAKAFVKLGIACYGFLPLTADPDGRIPDGVHGIDERIPVSSLIGGQRILDDFLRNV